MNTTTETKDLGEPRAEGANDARVTTATRQKLINKLAREWADYVGGLAQAKKIVEEAFEAGEQYAQRAITGVNANHNEQGLTYNPNKERNL